MSATLALDLATHCGFAFESAGVRESGVVNFARRKNERYGYLFIKFNAWLFKWKDRKLDLVVYEKPIPFHSGQAAAQIAYGFSSSVEAFAARYDIQCECVQNNVLKRWATGNGRADKDMMVKMAQVLKPGVESDDEADALHLLHYAKCNFLKEMVVQ